MKSLLLFISLFCSITLHAQSNFFQNADSLKLKRFIPVMATGLGSYTGTVIGLNSIWYAQYERTKFHPFNDMKEWEGMDKAGHLYTAYFETKWATRLLKWTGMKHKAAVWTGAAAGTFFQTTIEVLDGFSAKWGFSWGDVAFNTAGSAIFVAQELTWKEQRFVIKYSFFPKNYDNSPIQALNSQNTSSLETRAKNLYGTSLPELIFKDYNGTTVWLSANIHAFIKKDNPRIPAWLNIAVGYGAENMYGGFDNTWVDEDGNEYVASGAEQERYRQFFFAPDIDFTRIPIKRKGWKPVLEFLNVFKMPMPTFEITSKGKFKFHPLYF